MKVRRVVTGHDETGRSVFASDEDVDPTTVPLFAGWEFLELWGGDATPAFPDDGREPEYRDYFPKVDGFRFSFSVIPPEGTAPPDDLDLEKAEQEARAALPGMLDVLEPDDPGMHTTDTIDFEVILSGELVLELDDGAEKVLRPGDTVVQNGTRHCWHNRGAEPATMAAFMAGARRRS